MMQLLSECRESLRKGDIKGMEIKIEQLRGKPEEVLKCDPGSGFTNYLVYGAYDGFKKPYISSAFLQEITKITDERLLCLHRLRVEIDCLEGAFFLMKGMRQFHAGQYESAFSVWEKALQKAPSEKSIFLFSLR